MRRAGLLLLAMLFGGCVTAFPDDAVRGVDRSVTVEGLRAAPAAPVGTRVILGGEILVTHPRIGETEIEVLSRPLRSDDSPERSDRSDGRFLVRTAAFLDPAVYSTGRRLSALGTVIGDEERKIGDLPYRYPVIRSERIRLWPRDVVVASPPGIYDPPWPYGGVYPPWRPYRPWRHWPYWW